MIGRISIPGLSISQRTIDMPSCFLSSELVRTKQNILSAHCACVVHVFCPLMTYLSPLRSARVTNDAKSEPEPGSEYPWHHHSSPESILGRYRSCCSSVPNAIKTGPIILRPNGESLGAPSAEDSTSKICWYTGLHSQPPNFLGQLGATQPCWKSDLCH